MAASAMAGEDEAAGAAHGSAPGGLRVLTLAALGVVYGDIGTSPLYTLKEAFGHAGGLHPVETSVLGVLSLVFWSLILVVTVKYVVLILRADNRGEGGVLALGILAARGDRPAGAAPPRRGAGRRRGRRPRAWCRAGWCRCRRRPPRARRA